MRCQMKKLKQEQPLPGDAGLGQEKADAVEEADETCNGPVKPGIVFFGEPLPEKFHWGCNRIRNRKFNSQEENPAPLFEDGGCDLMIVIGTALAVYPFSITPSEPSRETPKVLINLQNTAAAAWDFEDLYNHPERLWLQGKCDDIIQKIVVDAGWSPEF